MRNEGTLYYILVSDIFTDTLNIQKKTSQNMTEIINHKITQTWTSSFGRLGNYANEFGLPVFGLLVKVDYNWN